MTEADTVVPAPVPPDDVDAWYAPAVRAQYAVAPGVVVTIRGDGTFNYEVREPSLTQAERAALDRVEDYFADANVQPPLTREGAVERLRSGFAPKERQAIDRLTDLSPAGRRRVDYHALASIRCLGDLTPLALDDRIETADASGDRLVVHTADFAPATTDRRPDDGFDAFAAERLCRYAVDFRGFEVPVVLYRERTVGNDPFAVKYAVLEPDLLPGDRDLVESCKERVWEAGVEGLDADGATVVRERAVDLLARQLTARNARAWLETLRYRVRDALAEYDLALPPVDGRFADDRLEDLLYYVLRDFVGYGTLTVPVRDPNLEDVEANRVDERIKVVPRADLHEGRVPTNLAFDDETAFVNVVTQLAAADGTELNASNPSAKVNLDPDGVDETIRCAVALPVISEDGPHISIRKQAADPMTPADLVRRNSISTELVATLWLLYEHRGVVLFSGPTGVGKTTLMNAHMPFVPYGDRPISIDEGSREVRLPHETGVSLTTRDHEQAYKRVAMADLMTEANYLNPDVEVIAEINTPASFETFAESLNTGHGVIGTTHAEDVEKLVNRVIEQGLPAYLLQEIDLVVFPRQVDGDRYVGQAVELLSEREYRDLDRRTEAGGRIEKDETTIHWNRVTHRTHDGSFRLAYDHPALGDDRRDVRTALFDRVATRTDRPVEAVEREFHRKHRYVEYVVEEDLSDFEDLFEFLADLRTDEAATVERVRRLHREEQEETTRGDD
jgi:type IV secretory pathway ATPase VirB11/archaellum biosynthesis ATPase